MARRAFRNFVFRTHTLVGLHISIFMAFLFLTGTILVAGLELQLATQPKVWTTAPLAERTASFGTLYDAVLAEYPEATVSVVEKRPRPWLASQIVARTATNETLSFWADPADGTLLGASFMHGLHDFLREMHDNLLLKKQPAFLLVTSMSIVLLAMIVSGLVTYRRFWRGFLRRPQGAAGTRGWLGGAHRLAAVWVVPMLIVTALTGFVFFLDGLGIRGTEPEPARAAERAALLPEGFDGATLDRADAAARAAMPGFQPRFAVLPGWRGGGIEFYGDHADSLISMGKHRVAVDPATMDILGAFVPSDITGMARIRPIVTMLHYGTWGGAVSRGLWIVFGLGAFGLALSGMLIFAARQPAAQAGNAGPLRRVWRGLGITRWAYLALALAMTMAAVYVYSPAFDGPVRLRAEAPDDTVELLAGRALRAGRAYPLTLRVRDPAVTAATVTLNAGEEQPVGLKPDEEAQTGSATIRPAAGGNTLTLRLTGDGGGGRSVTYHLGRPVW